MSPLINITNWLAQRVPAVRNQSKTGCGHRSRHPIFDQFCKPSCYVDEHYFPTMLSIESTYLLANRSLTWVDWSRGGAHPATFGKSDLTDEFFKKIVEGKPCLYNEQPTSVCFLFGRKIAPSALDHLLQNSSRFFGY